MYMKYIVWFLLMMVNVQCLSQLEKIDSLDILVEKNEYPFYVISTEEYGLVLYRERFKEIPDDYNDYEFLFYDKDLQLVWTYIVKTEIMFSVIQHEYANGHVFVVFAGIKNFKKKLLIYRFDIEAQTYEIIPIDTFFPINMSYFSLFNNTMIIGGRERSKPSIVFYNLDDMRPVILQGFYEKKITVYDISIDEENGLFTVLIGYKGKNGQGSLNIRSYDEFGQSVEDIRLEPERGKDLIQAKGIILNNTIRLVAGVYKDNKSLYPSGLFLTSIFLDGRKEIVYYPFNELLHLMDSINRNSFESQAEFIQTSIANDEKYLWHLTDVSEYGDENIAVVESYTTDKASTTFMDKNIIYQLKDALIVGFNDRLKLEWINHINMEPVISENLRKYITLKFYADSIRLSFFNRNQLVGKMIYPSKKDKPVFYVQFEDFEPGKTSEMEVHYGFSAFLPWYQDYHLFIGMKSNERNREEKIFLVRKYYFP